MAMFSTESLNALWEVIMTSNYKLVLIDFCCLIRELREVQNHNPVRFFKSFANSFTYKRNEIFPMFKNLSWNYKAHV